MAATPDFEATQLVSQAGLAPRVGLSEDELAMAYREHAEYATRLAFLLTGSFAANDICHDTFLRLGARCRVGPDSPQFRAYLRQSVIRTAMSVQRSSERRSRRETLVSMSEVAGPADHDPTEGRLGDALAELPHRQRAAVVLRYWEDLDDLEIARLLRCRTSTVRSLLHRARTQLKEALGNGPI